MRPLSIILTVVAFSTFSSVVYSRKHRHGPHRGCIKCPPGEGVVLHCNATHDTLCEPCAPGYFSLKHSHLRACQPCSRCGEGLYVAHSCTPTVDTICDSCLTVKGPHNRDFYRHCESDILATNLPIGLKKHKAINDANELYENKFHIKENIINEVKDINEKNIKSVKQLLTEEKHAIEEMNIALVRLQNTDTQLENALEQILKARAATTAASSSTIAATTRPIQTTMANKPKTLISRQHIEFHNRNSQEYPKSTQSHGKLWTSLTPSSTVKTAASDGAYALKRQAPKDEFNTMIGQSATTQWAIVLITLTCAVVFFGLGLIILHNVLKHLKPNLKGKWEPDEEEPHETEEQKEQLIRTGPQVVDLKAWKIPGPEDSEVNINAEEVMMSNQSDACTEEVPIDDPQEEKCNEEDSELKTS